MDEVDEVVAWTDEQPFQTAQHKGHIAPFARLNKKNLQ